jgi:hypothetical protein
MIERSEVLNFVAVATEGDLYRRVAGRRRELALDPRPRPSKRPHRIGNGASAFGPGDLSAVGSGV